MFGRSCLILGSLLAVLGILGQFNSSSAKEPEPDFTLKAYNELVYTLTFSPDGKMLATAGDDSDGTIDFQSAKIKLWDVATKKELFTVKDEFRIIYCLAFSPDGKTIAAGDSNKRVRVVDTAKGKENAVFEHADQVMSVAFSPDSKTLAAGALDGTVRLWDVASMKEQGSFKGNPATVTKVLFSPDGKTLAVAGGRLYVSGEVKLFNPTTGKEQAAIKDFDGQVTAIAYSSDGKTLAVGWARHTDKLGEPNVRLWDVAAGKEVRTFDKGHIPAPFSMTFTPDGTRLLTSGGDYAAIVWDVESGKQIAHFFHGSHRGAFSSDGKWFAIGGRPVRGPNVTAWAVSKLLEQKPDK